MWHECKEMHAMPCADYEPHRLALERQRGFIHGALMRTVLAATGLGVASLSALVWVHLK
jgi:hypothetical protein